METSPIADILLDAFRRYLEGRHHYAPSTAAAHVTTVRQFIDDLREKYGEKDWIKHLRDEQEQKDWIAHKCRTLKARTRTRKEKGLEFLRKYLRWHGRPAWYRAWYNIQKEKPVVRLILFLVAVIVAFGVPAMCLQMLITASSQTPSPTVSITDTPDPTQTPPSPVTTSPPPPPSEAPTSPAVPLSRPAR